MQIGLTGGVGAGKSTVARLLVEHGAVLVDADAVAREVVEPGTEGYEAIVGRFGAEVVAPDGRLDRPKLAAIVFADAGQRAALNAIVHPLVRGRMAQLAAAVPAGAVVVHDIPLLTEGDRSRRFDAVIVVEAPLELRLSRLRERGMAEQDARERMAAQASDEQRRALADEVIINDGSREQLAERVDGVWNRLRASGSRSASV